MNNINNSFTTSVFNGSTSLRSAAGELIEETVKWTRRNKDINDSFIDELYQSINALYKLDQIKTGAQKQSLGKLPTGAIALISTLIIVWIGNNNSQRFFCFV